MRGRMGKNGKLGKICCRFWAVCSLAVLLLCWLPGPVYAAVSDMVVYETGMEDVVIRGTGELFYAVEHEGNGKGTMAVTGNAAGAYDVVVKIVKGGVLGEAQFQISLDGGQSFVGQDTVSESSMIGGAGITLQFATRQDTDEFVQETPQIGQIYVYRQDGVFGGEMVIHRLIGITEEGLYQFKGDNNRYPDSIPVERGSIGYRVIGY